MTTEQQVLFDIGRSHARLACERLDETNVPFALSHLKEAQRALELIPTSSESQVPSSKFQVSSSKSPKSLTIEAEIIKP